jgi:hypothetical protein
MMNSKIIPTGLLIAILIAVGSLASDWSAYKLVPADRAWSDTVVIPTADYTIETANIKYTIDAIWTGQHRELPSARAELFRRWTKSLGHPPEYEALCRHEIEIKANNKTYWLPIQNPLFNNFIQEVKAGAQLHLRIMYVGAVGPDRIFMINDFDGLKP